MLYTLLNILILNLIVVIIVDMTDAPDTLKKVLSFILTKGKMARADYRFHLFDCSLCITFWLSLIYMILTGNLSLIVLCLCLLSALFTTVTRQVLQLTLDISNTIIILMNKLLKHIIKL